MHKKIHPKKKKKGSSIPLDSTYIWKYPNLYYTIFLYMEQLLQLMGIRVLNHGSNKRDQTISLMSLIYMGMRVLNHGLNKEDQTISLISLIYKVS